MNYEGFFQLIVKKIIFCETENAFDEINTREKVVFKIFE